jgi:hypothetical protein
MGMSDHNNTSYGLMIRSTAQIPTPLPHCDLQISEYIGSPSPTAVSCFTLRSDQSSRSFGPNCSLSGLYSAQPCLFDDVAVPIWTARPANYVFEV